MDAREPTAAQAVRKALQCFYDIHHSDRPDTVEKEMRAMAHDAGMNARVVNGRVRVDQLRNQGE